MGDHNMSNHNMRNHNMSDHNDDSLERLRRTSRSAINRTCGTPNNQSTIFKRKRHVKTNRSKARFTSLIHLHN